MIQKLPDELLCMIISHTLEGTTGDVSTLRALEASCRCLRTVSSGNEHWQDPCFELYKDMEMTSEEIESVKDHRYMYYRQMSMFTAVPNLLDTAVNNPAKRYDALMELASYGPFARMPLHDVLLGDPTMFSHQLYASHSFNSLLISRHMKRLAAIATDPNADAVSLIEAYHAFNSMVRHEGLTMPQIFALPLEVTLMERDGIDLSLPALSRAAVLCQKFGFPLGNFATTKVDFLTDTSMKNLSDVTIAGLVAYYGRKYAGLDVSIACLPFQAFPRIKVGDQEYVYVDMLQEQPLISHAELIDRCVRHGFDESVIDQSLSVQAVGEALTRDTMTTARQFAMQIVSQSKAKGIGKVPRIADSFFRLMIVKILFGQDKTQVVDAVWCASYVISHLWYQRPALLATLYDISPKYARHVVLDHGPILKQNLVPDYSRDNMGLDINPSVMESRMAVAPLYAVGQPVTRNNRDNCIVLFQGPGFYLVISEIDGLVCANEQELTPFSYMVALSYDKIGEYFSGFDRTSGLYIIGVDLAKALEQGNRLNNSFLDPPTNRPVVV